MLTMLRAALVALSLGRAFSAFGAGGGRAATCGDDASDDNEVAAGTTMGVGDSETDGCAC